MPLDLKIQHFFDLYMSDKIDMTTFRFIEMQLMEDPELDIKELERSVQ